MYQRYIHPYRAFLLFAAVFVIGLAAQATLWLYFPVADQNYWATDAATLASGEHLTPSSITYPHPGTTILYPMAALIHAGVEKGTAVRLVMAFFIALCGTLAGLVAYQLWPGHLWWLGVVLILFSDLRFLHGTPPSSAAAAAAVLYFLLVWYALQTAGNSRSLIYVGACAGVLIATRVDTGLFLLGTSLPFLFLVARWRIYSTLITAALALYICNPYLWTTPVVYLQSIPAIISSNEALVGRDILIPFFATFPFALISIVLSAVVVVSQYRNPITEEKKIPLPAYIWFLGATLLYSAILAPLRYHPLRYFMPFYVVWDILLPFWLFLLASRYTPSFVSRYFTQRRFETVAIVFIVLLIPLQLFVLLSADTMEIIL